MSFKKSFLYLLAAVGIIVVSIIYLSLPQNFSLLSADVVGSSPTETQHPTSGLSSGRSDTTVVLSTLEAEIGFAITNSTHHVGIEYLKNLTDSKTIYFDESKHLWTIAVLYPNAASSNPMEADSNLFYISFDDATIACDTLMYFLRNNYPGTNDKSLILNWVGIVDTTNFPNDTLNVDVVATIYDDAEDVSFSIRIEKVDADTFLETSLFNVDFPQYLVEEYDASAANQILAYPYGGHGNLIEDPILAFDRNEQGFEGLNQVYVPDHREMGFSKTLKENLGLHPGHTSQQFFSYYTKSDSLRGL